MPSETVLQRADRKRADEKRELADAAFEVFADRGYHQTRIADITAHVGVGQSTFYKHFANKREVVEHVLDRLTGELMDSIGSENAAPEADTLEQYVDQVGRITLLMFDALAAQPVTLRVLVREVVTVDPELEQRWRSILDLTRNVVAGYYENGIAKGYFRADLDVDASSEACVGLLVAGLERLVREPDDKDGYLRYVNAALSMVVESGRAR